MYPVKNQRLICKTLEKFDYWLGIRWQQRNTVNNTVVLFLIREYFLEIHTKIWLKLYDAWGLPQNDLRKGDRAGWGLQIRSWQIFFYKGPQREYFRLGRLYSLGRNYSTLPLSMKTTTDYTYKQMSVSVQ